MSFEIIKTTLDRAEDIGYVHAMSWKAAYSGIVPKEFLDIFTPKRRTEVFRKTFPTSKSEYYIAYVNNNPMGMLVIGKSQDDDANENVCEIECIYLLPEYWSKGYGRQHMDFAIGRLKELSYRRVNLWVLAENLRARRFYEKYCIIKSCFGIWV